MKRKKESKLQNKIYKKTNKQQQKQLITTVNPYTSRIQDLKNLIKSI